MVYVNQLRAFLLTASVDRTDPSPSDAMIVTDVSLDTFVVVIGNAAVADPAGTITNGGTAAAGLSLANLIVVYVGYGGAGAFSVTVAAVVVPPFTAGDSSVTLSNEALEGVGCGDAGVGCVGDGVGCVGTPADSSPPLHAVTMMTTNTQLNRPVTTTPF
jgi:hypothetical protein